MNLLFAVVLALLAVARTAGATPSHTSAAPVYQVTMTSITVNGVTLTTGTVGVELTQQYLPDSTDPAWFSVDVENTGADGHIACSQQIAVSCAAGNQNQGWFIDSSTSSVHSKEFVLQPGSRLYCTSCKTSATSGSAVFIRRR